MLKKVVSENKLAAIMFETVQGEGGVVPLTQEFVDAIKDICEKEDILMIVDEVQTGNGRTGKLFGYMHYGVSPDIVTTAKGLGGGLPIGAVIMGEKTKDVLTSGTHGSTFGGNPVACAGAVNIISRLTYGFLEEVNRKSKFIIDELINADGVKSVTGLGLMLGIETEKDVNEVLAYCQQNGVLPIKAKNKLRHDVSRNYYDLYREYPYKNIKPKIIIEKYLVDSNNEDLRDYKFFCFNGRVYCLYIITDRFSENGLKLGIFDSDGKKLNYYRTEDRRLEKNIELPNNFEEMTPIDLAAILKAAIIARGKDFATKHAVLIEKLS
jgi:hypothetical protein